MKQAYNHTVLASLQVLLPSSKGHLLFISFFKKKMDILWAWQQRTRERRLFLQMSDETLKDIGLSRADIVAEARKPFWRV